MLHFYNLKKRKISMSWAADANDEGNTENLHFVKVQRSSDFFS